MSFSIFSDTEKVGFTNRLIAIRGMIKLMNRSLNSYSFNSNGDEVGYEVGWAAAAVLGN